MKDKWEKGRRGMTRKDEGAPGDGGRRERAKVRREETSSKAGKEYTKTNCLAGSTAKSRPKTRSKRSVLGMEARAGASPQNQVVANFPHHDKCKQPRSTA